MNKLYLIPLALFALVFAQITPTPPEMSYDQLLAKGKISKTTYEQLIGSATLDSGVAFAPWGQTYARTLPTAYTPVFVSSTDSTDTTDIEVTYLNKLWQKAVEVITIEGNTPQLMTDSVWRVLKTKNVGYKELAGKALTWQSVAYTAGVPDDSTKILSEIPIGKLRSTGCVWTTAVGEGAYIWTLDLTSTANWVLWTQPVGGLDDEWTAKTQSKKVPFRVPPMTDFELRALSDSTLAVECELEMELQSW
jgi:hypothetical protein